MAKITVRVTPTSGRSRQVEVELSGAPLSDVLKAANLSPDGLQYSVDGKPATLDTIVPDGAKVTMTEKARGS